MDQIFIQNTGVYLTEKSGRPHGQCLFLTADMPPADGKYDGKKL